MNSVSGLFRLHKWAYLLFLWCLQLIFFIVYFKNVKGLTLFLDFFYLFYVS